MTKELAKNEVRRAVEAKYIPLSYLLASLNREQSPIPTQGKQGENNKN